MRKTCEITCAVSALAIRSCLINVCTLTSVQPQMRQQFMMQRARVPGPQQSLGPGPQQSLGPGMATQPLQNNAAQSFSVLSDDLGFDLS
jgi:hypothetical protein